MRVSLLPFTVIGIALANAPAVHAWGAAGHEIVATIAQIHLPKPVLTLVCDILRPSLNLSEPAPVSTVDAYPPCSLAPIAAWADRIRMKPEYRYTAPLHYVNAGRPTGNVLAALGNVTSVLREFADGQRSVGDAEEALKFLVHWMGDMHQPLHMSGREKGGNGAKVTWNGRITNLHSVWDGLLIAQSIRQTPRNYSRPLTGAAGAIVEPHLRGAIYDPYIRRIMHEGLSVGGRFDEESRSWLDCPTPESEGLRTSDLTYRERAQALLAMDFYAALGLTTRPGTEAGWDDAVLCPFAWAKPIHKLNCELPVWPHDLDPAGSHPSDFDVELDADDFGAEANGAGRPRHPELFELDTPEYAGKIAKEWVVERLLAMAGVRLAGVLTDVFQDVDV
ncbi:phospholipase C/P1 nuclease domain-containing protein [Cerioporus squamosus]|nr:phospholipase C/P1 nuclease domain-containing protein [Cerioporus squamosus]